MLPFANIVTVVKKLKHAASTPKLAWSKSVGQHPNIVHSRSRYAQLSDGNSTLFTFFYVFKIH